MRQWIEYKLKKKLRKRYARVAAAAIRIWQHLSGAGGGADDRFVTSRYGVRMRANWADRTFQYCYFATYGRYLADYLARYGEDFVFLDVGANQGLYSLLAPRNPHCQAVVALEPVARTFELLQQNVAANGLADRVTCIRAALSERSGSAEISVTSSHSGTATLAQGPNYDPSSIQTIELVDIGQLDARIPEGARIVVKVDVEGYERVVLAELLRSRHAARMAVIFYEVDNRWSEAESLQQLLSAAGFCSFARHGRGRHYDVLASRTPEAAA